MSDKLANKTRQVFKSLNTLHHDATIELNFKSPLELLVATILSAQCTDVKVNQVTKELFKRYRKPKDYLQNSPTELERLIKPTGFYRNKAKNIIGAMRMIENDFGGKVPQTMEDLVKLPGVGRKTANVLLGNAFDTPGLPVDTHVTRLVNRIGISKQTDAVKIETELNQLVPKKNWTLFSHTLIFHGRRVCKAKKPNCEECPITHLCDYYKEHLS